jgi:phosphatidylglycerol:prolipoprotein diacylglycerol transferase
MAALTLSQMTARLARLDPAKVWDAALTMVLAALVFSRVLLVVGSWHSFLEAPLLVLALPSLNDTGILLTAIFTVVYLRWKKLPLLGFLDAMGPCFALVWAFLSLGELIAGTREGMPTQFLLSMKDDMLGKVQPVELYTMLVAMVLCGVLIRWLPRRRAAGLGFGLWLVLTGAASCLLGFLRLPSELYGTAILDPVQWLGLVMVIVGAALFIALPVVAPDTAEKEASNAV